MVVMKKKYIAHAAARDEREVATEVTTSEKEILVHACLDLHFDYLLDSSNDKKGSNERQAITLSQVSQLRLLFERR
jgi:hypothetical protein